MSNWSTLCWAGGGPNPAGQGGALGRWFLGLQGAVPASSGWRGPQWHHRVVLCVVQSRQSISVIFKDKNLSVSITATSPKP